MQIELRRTWQELGEHLRDNPLPLSILKAVNVVPLHSWTYEFTFDVTDRVNVLLRPAWPLTWGDCVQLLDGRIPELLNCEELTLEGAGGVLRAYPEPGWSVPRGNVLALTGLLLEPVDRLRLIGFGGHRLAKELQSPEHVERYLAEHTRFGSHAFRRSSETILWKVLAGQRTYRIVSRLDSWAEKLNKSFRREQQLTGGVRLFGLTSPELRSTTIYHSDWGRIDPSEYGVPLTNGIGGEHWLLEVEAPNWNFGSLGRLVPVEQIAASLHNVVEAVQAWMQHPQYRGYHASIVREEQVRAVVLLTRRQESARQSKYVYYGERRLHCVPRSENDLVMLYAKCEALGALPFECHVLEYTPREGIDALADFRFTDLEPYQRLAPVEFELTFANFLAHAHPIAQVRAIICWELGDTRKDLRLIPVAARPWQFSYTHDGYSVPVLVLSHFPSLTIRPWS